MAPTDGLRRGQRVIVTLHNDERRRVAVYLGPSSDAVDRTDRRMFALDDGEAWRMVMEPTVDTVIQVDRPITLIVAKAGISVRDLEEITDLMTEANRDPGNFYPIIPTDLVEQVKLVTVQDVPDAPDAVELLRKILVGNAHHLRVDVTDVLDLTATEAALVRQLQS